MTVITSTYWDLFRIYDQSAAYQDKMRQTGRQLAKFVPYSTIYPDIIRKAESFQRSAKNPGIVKEFLQASGRKKSGCFIATAAFGSADAYEVNVLRLYRDQVLLSTQLGRLLIKIYYRISPPLAEIIAKHRVLQLLSQAPLRVIARLANLSLKRDSDS